VEGGDIMELWDIFYKSGRIEDYLRYRESIENDHLERTDTQRKGQRRGE
jgi:hypothetical protein